MLGLLKNREPSGGGCMGAIWDRDRGIPPLGIEPILALCHAI
jgi:hypothetical protein